MTTPAEAVTDPVGTVVSLVTAADPALGHDLVRRIVEQVGGGRSKRRRLAAELAGNPSVLTTGRSPASKVAGDLMLALRAAGATGISPPWCADCGRRVTSMQRRGEHWYCAPCYVRPEACAGCGNTRQVAFRDRQGRPRCSKCPDQDARDPLLVLVEVITMTDPALPAEAVTAAIEATVTKQAHLQKLAWLLHGKPELLTGDGAKAPFPVVLRLIDALCEAGATRIRRPACPRCRRVITLSKQRDGLRICRNCCARARAVPCAKCGTIREPAARDGQGRPLCPYCLVSDPVNLEECVRCRRRRQVSTRTSQGPVCATCNPPGILTCSSCGRTAPCTVSKITGQPRCGACARSWARCSTCGQLAPARAGTRDAPLCGDCAVPGPGFFKTCPACGSPGRLIAGACRRCHLRQRLDELLADGTGNVRPELQVLHQTLATTDRPATVLTWLSSGTSQTMLTELAAGLRPLTHAALDELPASKPLTHLRSVLVATGALPARDEHFVQLERWTTQTVAGRADPQEKEILHRYAVWHVLRRLRHRIRGTHATCNQADVARRNIAAAVTFLNWLTARDLTLASCPQADLDQWMAGASTSQRGPTGHFIRWAKQPEADQPGLPGHPVGRAHPRHRHRRTLGTSPAACCTTTPSSPKTGSLGCSSCSTPSSPPPSAALPSVTSSPAAAKYTCGSAGNPSYSPNRSPVSSFTWSPPARATPPPETRAPPHGCCPADAPASRSAPTGSTNASTRSASAPDQPAPPPCSSSPPNSPPPSSPACSASTSTSPSPGSAPPPATG